MAPWARRQRQRWLLHPGIALDHELILSREAAQWRRQPHRRTRRVLGSEPGQVTISVAALVGVEACSALHDTTATFRPWSRATLSLLSRSAGHV